MLHVPLVMGAALATLVWFAPVAGAKDPQLSPKRLSSVGDSITEAINAEEFSFSDATNPNPWASYANGYRGFWEWLLGRTNVNSHNQRISSRFGSENRKNFLVGKSGADSFDLQSQMQKAVQNRATYVPVFMGHNDACQEDFSDIPSDEAFEANVRAGLEELRAGLPSGATVCVMAILDIYRLWQIGQDLKSLGFVDCEVVWLATLFEIYPCATMLSILNSEADRQFTRNRIIAFNRILEDVVAEYEAEDERHHYAFADSTFRYEFVPSQVSGFDCFHPSGEGQRELSRVTWEAGPFSR